MDQLAQGYLGKRTMGLGVPAIRSVKKAIRGEPFDFTGALKNRDRKTYLCTHTGLCLHRVWTR